MTRRGHVHRIVAAVVALGIVAAACSDDDEPSASSAEATSTTTGPAPTTTAGTEETAPAPETSVDGTEPATTAAGTSTTEAAETTTTDPGPTTPRTTLPRADDELIAAITTAVDGAAPGCDPLDTRHCLLPFPSSAYFDDGHVAFDAEALPANVDGVHMDPAEWNRNDGFSPNTPILAYFAGLDPVGSRLPSWTDLEQSLADDATVLLVDVDTGERMPLWAELDAKADDDADRLLEIHPAVALRENHTYAVGLRQLVDTAGTLFEPSPAFVAYRDAVATGIPAIEQRRNRMEATFAALEDAGAARDELQLAWSFKIASSKNISGRMLSIRDEALQELGRGNSPEFTVTAVTENPSDNIAFQIAGTFTVPNYLTNDGSPGNRFFYGDGVIPTADELPVQNGTLEAPFLCNVSVATMEGDEPAHLVLYGHGLLGSEDEINAGNVRAFANEHNVVFCATKWAGMSEDDIPNAVETLTEMGQFPTMADRLQQGVLNQIFLGRFMTNPKGLVTIDEMRRSSGSPLVDTAHLDYDGNSQGGIMGLMLVAVSQDIERAVVGVVGQNYSLLLSRSVDFETYEQILEPAYPNDLDRVLVIALVQMLWDRGEGAGYIQHIRDDTYRNTPAKEVLLHVAFGDWQVSELSAMVAARTMGVPIHRPVTDDGRSQEVEPGWGLDSITYPSDGSGLVIWDSGSDPIPIANIPPSTSRDPHEDPRAAPHVRLQKASFLFADTLIDVCDGQPCKVDPVD